MKIIYANELPLSDELKTGIAATIGFFDGVHLGHRFLINQLKERAKELSIPSAVITFPVHPRKILQANYLPELLTTFEEKLYQLSTTGVDYCIVIDFSKELSEYTAGLFIQKVLSEQLNVKSLLVGYDHKFGKDRADGFEQYKEYGKTVQMEIVLASPLLPGEKNLSSTLIRKLLQDGNVREASQLLSYNYELEGIVVDGNKMGRKMGFPTANIQLSDAGKIIPSIGIYAVRVRFDNQQYKGMLYIGNRPTLFEQGECRIEVNIFNFEGNLYNKDIVVEFVDFIREDIKFNRPEDLIKQLEQDNKTAISLLA